MVSLQFHCEDRLRLSNKSKLYCVRLALSLLDAFIYCGLSGGTRRDTECLFLAFTQTPTAIPGLLFTT